MPNTRLDRDTVYTALQERGLIPVILDSLTPPPPRPSKANASGWRRRGCPIHGSSDSLSVNDHHGGFKCWSCGASGDVFSLWMQVHRVDFPTALRDIASTHGLSGIEARTPGPPSPATMNRLLASWQPPNAGGARGTP